MIVELTVQLAKLPILDVKLGSIPTLNASVQTAHISIGTSDGEVYQGGYQVVPKSVEQVLDTAQKYLSEDITVLAIPFYEVSNGTGGNTIYIGSEV